MLEKILSRAASLFKPKTRPVNGGTHCVDLLWNCLLKWSFHWLGKVEDCQCFNRRIPIVAHAYHTAAVRRISKHFCQLYNYYVYPLVPSSRGLAVSWWSIILYRKLSYLILLKLFSGAWYLKHRMYRHTHTLTFWQTCWLKETVWKFQQFDSFASFVAVWRIW